MVLFKPGYKFRGLSNYPLTNYNKSSLRKSDWNGKTIKLEKFKGNLREYAEHLSYMTIGLRFMEQECNWKKTPKMILAIDQQHQVIVQSGIDSSLHLINSLEGVSASPNNKCGPVRDYLHRSQK